MRKRLYACTDWFYASWIARVINKVLVAEHRITYNEVIELDPSVGLHNVTCGVCTAIRTAVVTAGITSFIWWAL